MLNLTLIKISYQNEDESLICLKAQQLLPIIELECSNMKVSTFRLLCAFVIVCLSVQQVHAGFLDKIKQFFRMSSNNTSDDYNPDLYLSVPYIIKRHGYSVESHIVQTEDGYLLTVHRIPKSKSGKKGEHPVLLQHGLLGSSADWIVNGENALAYTLADSGYDVWMGNARGNTYSKAHVSFSTSSSKFWDFSWHEMGIYDLPAVISYIQENSIKKQKIVYIGHSMGTTMFFVMASKVPKAADQIKLMIALAPSAYMTHIRSPVKYLTPFANDVQWFAKNLGINQFLPQNRIMKFLAGNCDLDQKICKNIVFVLVGFDKNGVDPKIVPTILSHAPAGTSTKTVMHYAQEIKGGGRFQQFDYGKKKNLNIYGSELPPEYDVRNITTPIYLVYAEADVLASPIDVLRLSENITELVGIRRITRETFDHVDFIFAKDAIDLVYKPIIKVIQDFETVD